MEKGLGFSKWETRARRDTKRVSLQRINQPMNQIQLFKPLNQTLSSDLSTSVIFRQEQSSSMLAIKKSEKSTSCVANVLPCRIQHNGPVNATTRHWTPESSSDGQTNTAYFRGRKLNGKTVNLPEGYRGMFLRFLSSNLAGRISSYLETQHESIQHLCTDN
jgi:hypothetical protein